MALLLAMPAVALRPANVLAGIKEMSTVYGWQEIGSYWDQAVHRAEWDLPLEHPEVGIVFLVLTVAGLAVALRDRRWSRSVWGWLLFAAATGALVAPYKFRAFRNLLSLVPLACVVVALLYAAVRRRFPRPLWVDAAATLLPVVLFAPALHQYLTYQVRLEDTRETALRWLGGHARPGDRILFAQELVFLPDRIATMPNDTLVWPWDTAWGRIVKRRPQYLVLGQINGLDGKPLIQPVMASWLLEHYRVAATFGSSSTFSGTWNYLGNQQIIYILKRLPVRVPSPRREAEKKSAPPSRDPEPSADPPG